MPFWQPMRSATATPWQRTSRWRSALLANSRRLIDALIEEHGGRIFNTAGDSVLAEFLGPSEAVRCGLAVQEALHGANSEIPLLTFRIGIALGEVVVDGANLLGRHSEHRGKARGHCPCRRTLHFGRRARCDCPRARTRLAGSRLSPSQEPGRAGPCLSLRWRRRRPAPDGGRGPKASDYRAPVRQPGRAGRGEPISATGSRKTSSPACRASAASPCLA